MTIEEIKKYVSYGNEIEFQFQGKRFSITYGEFHGKELISFCEFYKETTEVKTVDELLKVKRYGVTVEKMLSECTAEDISIF